MRIANDTVVTIVFDAVDEAGNVLDSRDRKNPLVYTHGRDRLLPGLARALEGREAGETFRVHLTPEDAYGEKRELKTVEVAASDLPEGVSPETGVLLMAEGPDGVRVPMWVEAVDGERVTLSADNPLAGRSLHFKVTVVSVQGA